MDVGITWELRLCDDSRKFVLKYQLDSVAGLIHLNGQYLLQHRENLPSVRYPGWWGLFGGSREVDETAEEAIKREICEELNLQINTLSVFIESIYARPNLSWSARKIYFDIPFTKIDRSSMLLQEGQDMAWFEFDRILKMGVEIVPYDIGIIALHHQVLLAKE